MIAMAPFPISRATSARMAAPTSGAAAASSGSMRTQRNSVSSAWSFLHVAGPPRYGAAPSMRTITEREERRARA